MNTNFGSININFESNFISVTIKKAVVDRESTNCFAPTYQLKREKRVMIFAEAHIVIFNEINCLLISRFRKHHRTKMHKQDV